MKHLLVLLLGASLCFSSHAQLTEPQVIERGASHRVVNRVEKVTLPDGRIIERPNSYVELANGLHYLENGQWLDSRNELELFRDGVIGRKTQHKLVCAPNIATPGAIDVETVDGLRLQTHVLGLGIFDPQSNNSMLLAGVKDSIGQLHPPNTLVYPDAFDEVAADIRYVQRIDGLSQDVLLRQAIVLPDGFSAATTLLEVWTEFVNPPAPKRSSETIDGRADDTLEFGSMRIGAGKAFSLSGGGRSIPVTKGWMTIQNRVFLVEAVPVARANAELARIGIQQAATKPKNRDRLFAANLRPFPPAPNRKPTVKKVETAALAMPTRGLVVDYELSGTLGSQTLKGDTTYHLVGNATVTNLTIEGGTVVKFTNGVSLQIPSGGTVDCQTDPYRIAVFTSQNDDSAGAIIGTSTGNPVPSSDLESGFLVIAAQSNRLSNVRFSYAFPAIRYGPNTTNHIVRHAQFVHCPVGVEIDDFSNVRLENVLMYDLDYAIYGIQFSAVAEHLTVSECMNLVLDDYGGSPLALTNCLLVNVTNWGNATVTSNSTYKVSGSNILQTVGGGSAYLAASSPYRDVGTTNINAALLKDIRRGTTYPPLSIESTNWYSTNLALVPRAQRDTDAPDLGFHYWPMDFVFGGLKLTNATLTASNGVVIGTRNVDGYGITVGGAATFLSGGTPNTPNRIVRYNVVQEQATTNWASLPEFRIYTGWSTSAISPRIEAQFTHWATLASGGEHVYVWIYDAGSHTFTHSEFHNGDLWCENATASFTNCLFNRAGLNILDRTAAISPNVRHCTFRGGSHNLSRAKTGTWTLLNNLFDDSTIPVQDAVVTANYNGYTATATRLTNFGLNDVVLATVTNILYRSNTLGRFYLPHNVASHSTLTNSGSANADTLGFYHFTVFTNQVKEAATKIDIGYHSVATDTSGNPLDADSDGLPDYLEDFNGNNALNSGETATGSASDWGLKVFITRPRKGGQLP